MGKAPDRYLIAEVFPAVGLHELREHIGEGDAVEGVIGLIGRMERRRAHGRQLRHFLGKRGGLALLTVAGVKPAVMDRRSHPSLHKALRRGGFNTRPKRKQLFLLSTENHLKPFAASRLRVRSFLLKESGKNYQLFPDTKFLKNLTQHLI